MVKVFCPILCAYRLLPLYLLCLCGFIDTTLPPYIIPYLKFTFWLLILYVINLCCLLQKLQQAVQDKSKCLLSFLCSRLNVSFMKVVFIIVWGVNVYIYHAFLWCATEMVSSLPPYLAWLVEFVFSNFCWFEWVPMLHITYFITCMNLSSSICSQWQLMASTIVLVLFLLELHLCYQTSLYPISWKGLNH